MVAFSEAARFFAAQAASRGETTDPSIGPKIAMMCAGAGIEPLAVRLFPVSKVQLGCPRNEVWTARRAPVERALASSPAPDVRATASAYLLALDAYRDESRAAAERCVENPATRRSLPPLAKSKSNGGSRLPLPASEVPRSAPEGHYGWDDYAPFNDWENARTLGRRDLPFWRTVARQADVRSSNWAAARTAVGSAGSSRRAGRGSRSVGADAGARPPPGSPRRDEVAAASHPRRHPAAAVRRRHAPLSAFRDGAGAVRDAAVAAARSRSDSDPGGGASCPRPGGTLGIELVAALPSADTESVTFRWRGRAARARLALKSCARTGPALTSRSDSPTSLSLEAVRTLRVIPPLSVPQMVRMLEKAGFECRRCWALTKPRGRARLRMVILAQKPGPGRSLTRAWTWSLSGTDPSALVRPPLPHPSRAPSIPVRALLVAVPPSNKWARLHGTPVPPPSVGACAIANAVPTSSSAWHGASAAWTRCRAAPHGRFLDDG